MMLVLTTFLDLPFFSGISSLLSRWIELGSVEVEYQRTDNLARPEGLGLVWLRMERDLLGRPQPA